MIFNGHSGSFSLILQHTKLKSLVSSLVKVAEGGNGLAISSRVADGQRLKRTDPGSVVPGVRRDTGAQRRPGKQAMALWRSLYFDKDAPPESVGMLREVHFAQIEPRG
jgi:hypothetical protein